MTFKRVAPPAGAQRALEAALGDSGTQERRARRAATESAAPWTDAVPAAPLPRYAVKVTDIIAGIPLAAMATHDGWRYLVAEGADLEAADVGEADGDHQVFRWNRSPFNTQLQAVLARTESAEELKGGEYEPRVLVVPGLCIYALWLWQDAGDSLVIPLSPTDPELEPYRTYTAEAFTAALAGPALRRRTARDPE